MIVIVEDSAFQRILLQKSLSKWPLRCFSHFDEFIADLKSWTSEEHGAVRMVVLDWFISGASALETALRARALGLKAEIILYTDAGVSSENISQLLPCSAMPKKIDRLVRHIEGFEFRDTY